MARGNPALNQSDAGVPLQSSWGQAFRRLVLHGTRGRAAAVRVAPPVMYHAYDARVSGTLLYPDYLGSFATRPFYSPPVVRQQGYAGVYPMDFQPRLKKAYPWNDPTRGAP